MQSLKSAAEDGNILGKVKIAVSVNVNINKLLANPNQDVNAFKHIKASNDFSLSTAPIDKEISNSQFQSQLPYVSGHVGVARKNFSFGGSLVSPNAQEL